MGCVASRSAASTSFCAAANSPSAWMILERFSRSASACLAMARSMDSGRSTCLTSTLTTLTPQGSVRWSMMVWMRWLRASRCDEETVELDFAEHRAERGLGELRGLVDVVGDLDDRLGRVEHAQGDDGVDLDGDVVAGDDVLRRDFQDLLSQGDADDLVEGAEDEDDSGAFRLGRSAAEAEDDATLVLAKNLDRAEEIKRDYQNNDENRNTEHGEPPGCDCIAAGRGAERLIGSGNPLD